MNFFPVKCCFEKLFQLLKILCEALQVLFLTNKKLAFGRPTDEILFGKLAIAYISKLEVFLHL